MIMDDMAYLWPCPLFCVPSANDGVQSEAQWQAYNSLCTGSAKHWQQSRYMFDAFSSARNPQPEYGACVAGIGDSCGSDREMPEVLAPGSHPYEPPDAYDPSNQWYAQANPLYCRSPTNPDSQYLCGYDYQSVFPGRGTSFAAPILNGMAARVISSNPILLAHRPDAVKMVMMLTAHDVDSAYWDPSVDGHDGAGVISAYDAVEYATSCTDLSFQSDPEPVECGFATGEADTGFAERTLTVRIPDSPPVGRHLRVALVWTSNPDLDNGYNSLSDLDIGGFAADSGVYGSYSLDASVEMFDVPRQVLTPGRNYTFTLYPRDIRIPAGSRSGFFYYSLGWTWVPDHAGTTAVAASPAVRAGTLRATARLLGGGRLLLTTGTRASGTVHFQVLGLGGRVLASGEANCDGSNSCSTVLEKPQASGMLVVRLRGDGVSAVVPLVATGGI
jgi:hypothetical protein